MESRITVLSALDSLQMHQQFADDVLKGLLGTPKTISSMYFYDKKGSELFQKITQIPAYYLTRAEEEILKRYGKEILEIVNGAPLNLIELGAGCGEKTRRVLAAWKEKGSRFTYIPIDIDQNVLVQLGDEIERWFGVGGIVVEPVAGEYLQALDWVESRKKGVRKVVFFPGSNIGNFDKSECETFLSSLRSAIRPGDFLLIGFDQKKDPRMIEPAYDDAQGVTRDFNLNLLTRVNRELGGEFDLGSFIHHAYYDPAIEAMVSWLLSTKEQTVRVKEIGLNVHFEAGEGIRTEYSRKFSVRDIEKLARKCHFDVVRNFTDERGFFVNSLWTRKE